MHLKEKIFFSNSNFKLMTENQREKEATQPFVFVTLSAQITGSSVDFNPGVTA